MEAYLPAALLHLREGEIVRICGLARAARGQEAARTGRVQQPERSGGALQATMLEDERAGPVLACFSDAGLEFWECFFHPRNAPPEAAEPACEHLAALLTLWLRHPEQFRVLTAPSPPASSASPSQHAAQPGAAMSATQARPEPRAEPEQSQTSAPDSGGEQTSFAPPSLQRQLERLEALERRFLETLALAGGSMTESEVSRVFARLGLGTPEELVVLLGRLSVAGWVQPLYAGKRAIPRGVPIQPVGWRVPDEALALLPRIMPLQPLFDSAREAAVSDAEALPPETGLHAQPALEGLPSLLVRLAAQMAYRAASEMNPGTTQAAPRPSLPATNSFSTGPDRLSEQAERWAQALGVTPEQARFCSLLARLLGLGPPAQTASSGAARNTADTPAQLSHEQASDLLLRAYRLLLGRDRMEALRDVALHWLHAHSAHELRELRDAGVHVAALIQREARRSPDIAAENQVARQQIVDLLRFVPAGRWWSFSSLVEFLWAFLPDFLRGRQQAFLRPQWWLERVDDGRALSLEVRADWRQAEGRYLALLFRRALHWLGLVDLALDERGRLKGFRITPAGVFLLSALSGDKQREKSAQALTVSLPAGDATPAEAAAFCSWRALDDGRLVVPLVGLHEQTLALLLRWCEPGGATTDGLVFWPTAERAAAALDAGHDLETWLAWLGQGEQTGPQSVLIAQGRRWAGMYGRVRLYESAALLEVADPALMRELEAAVALSTQYLDHALSPDLAVVRADALEALLEALSRRGYAPWEITDETPDRS